MATPETEIEWARSLQSVAAASIQLAEGLELSEATSTEFVGNINRSAKKFSTNELGNLALTITETTMYLLQPVVQSPDEATHSQTSPTIAEAVKPDIVPEVEEKETEEVVEGRIVPLVRKDHDEKPAQTTPGEAEVIQLKPPSPPTKATPIIKKLPNPPPEVPAAAKKSLPQTWRKNSRRTDTESAEPPEQNSVRLYYREIARYPLIDKEEEQRLSRLMKTGVAASERLTAEVDSLSETEKRQLQKLATEGQAAKTKFIQSNLRLVVHNAKRFRRPPGFSLLDAIQEGNLGLEHAVDKFEGEKGFKFSTYGTWWIKQAIQRGISNLGSTIRIPIAERDLLAILYKSEEALSDSAMQAGAGEVSDENIAEDMGISVARVRNLRETRGMQPGSLNRQVGRESDTELQEIVGDQHSAEALDTAESEFFIETTQEKWRKFLDEREIIAITGRVGLLTGEVMSLDEIGQRIGLTRERVRQIESIGLLKLARQKIFPELAKLCNLDDDEIIEFKRYFLADISTEIPKNSPYDKRPSELRYEDTAHLVHDILELSFGKERIQTVIREVLEEQGAQIDAVDKPGRLFTIMMRRFGLNLKPTWTNSYTLQKRVQYSPAQHRTESEILRRLVGMSREEAHEQ